MKLRMILEFASPESEGQCVGQLLQSLMGGGDDCFSSNWLLDTQAGTPQADQSLRGPESTKTGP